MTVGELIKKLQEYDEDLKIEIDTGETSGGCSTCGYGGYDITKNVGSVLDFETKIVIDCY